MKEDKYLTRQTLLQRAQQQDDAAWEEFVSVYRSFIYHILHKMNMRPNDFEDLVQEILIKLWKGLKSYDSGKSKFRTWLSQVTRNAVLNYYRSRKKEEGSLSFDSTLIDKYFAQFTDHQLEDMFEKEWQSYICSVAFEAIKLLFSGQAIEAFQLKQQEVPTDEICKKLNLKRDTVYVLVSRVKSKYLHEIRRLIRETEF